MYPTVPKFNRGIHSNDNCGVLVFRKKYLHFIATVSSMETEEPEQWNLAFCLFRGRFISSLANVTYVTTMIICHLGDMEALLARDEKSMFSCSRLLETCFKKNPSLMSQEVNIESVSSLRWMWEGICCNRKYNGWRTLQKGCWDVLNMTETTVVQAPLNSSKCIHTIRRGEDLIVGSIH